MRTLESEIERASKELLLPAGALRRLQGVEQTAVLKSVLDAFVIDPKVTWWWAHLRQPGVSVTLEAGDGWRLLARVAPSPNAAVWLVTHDEGPEAPALYETSPAIAQAVIGECCAFEYYIVDQSFSWLICENHHNVVIAVGAPVEGRLLENAA